MKLKEFGSKPTAKQMNKVVESRFGFKIDFDNMTFRKAYTLATGLNESIGKIKTTHGVHVAEKNPQYMELLMVRESLDRWMLENKQVLVQESEMAKSEAILAAKSIVDDVQDMLEKISKMQNEQLPALLDTIRDQISMEKAEAFKGAISPLLQQLSQTLQQGRETADTAARALAGEGAGEDMGMGGMGAEPGMGADLGGMGSDLGGDLGGGMGAPEGDAFGATDAAAGGEEELGRERRGMAEAKKAKPDFADIDDDGDETETAKKAAKDAKAKK